MKNELTLKKVESAETSEANAKVAVGVIEGACLRKEFGRTLQVCDIFTINSAAQIRLIMDLFQKTHSSVASFVPFAPENLDIFLISKKP